jgi:hypothetical protein
MTEYIILLSEYTKIKLNNDKTYDINVECISLLMSSIKYNIIIFDSRFKNFVLYGKIIKYENSIINVKHDYSYLNDINQNIYFEYNVDSFITYLKSNQIGFKNKRSFTCKYLSIKKINKLVSFSKTKANIIIDVLLNLLAHSGSSRNTTSKLPKLKKKIIKKINNLCKKKDFYNNNDDDDLSDGSDIVYDVDDDLEKTIKVSDRLIKKYIIMWKCKLDNGICMNYPPHVNDKIVAAYKKKQKTVNILFNNFNYKLNFKKMTQLNLKTKKKRDILKSKDEITTVIHKINKLTITSSPEYWNKMDNHLEYIELENTNDEYGIISTKFNNTLSNYKIKKIFRIQNVKLYRRFYYNCQMFKEEDKCNIEYLFHGTFKTNPYLICGGNEGLDFRMSSSSNYYGSGIYFAKDAIYSNSFAYSKNVNTNIMLCCQVLLGNSYDYGSQKNYDLKRPPCNSSNGMYDTVKGNQGLTNGIFSDIYCIYELYRCYPEYLIEYDIIANF